MHLIQNYLSKLEQYLDLYLVKKAPSLPADWKKELMKYSSLVGVGLSVFVVLVYLGSWVTSVLGFIILIVQCALFLSASPALSRRLRPGWYQLLYGVLIGAVYYISTLQLLYVVLVSGLSLYFLYQVKEYYE